MSNRGPSTPDTVFISIAAYRDPDLIPTIEDCLAKAQRPDRLVFGICWQHADGETLPDWLRGSGFRMLDIDWRDSRGACWSRAEVMQLYDGERWYLQLDSHHRFIRGWDDKLIRQAALTGSRKPVLSTYAAAFSPGKESDAVEQVTRMDFDRFTREGAILAAPGVMREPPGAPMRARFLSAHFLFAPGSFVDDVPYDGDLYFIGEEITLAVRAFTHGYDLFHPSEHLVWHEYTRAQRPRHWDDHTHEGGAKIAWHERDATSLERVASLLTAPHVGRYGVGTTRSVHDYEAYAGVSFGHRRVQDYTRAHLEPPNPAMDPHWPENVRDRTIEMRLSSEQLPTAALEDPTFWYVGIHDTDGNEIYRRDADPAEIREVLATDGPEVALVREFESEAVPASWTVLPHSASQGWLSRITGQVQRGGSIFVSVAAYRDPDLVPTIEDCLAKAHDPERLVFGICWQHGADESLPDWFSGQRFRILDVNWLESRGPCWARAELMKLWRGEDWYLQLDSHHRFVAGWDAKLIRQATLTGSAKPLLSAPAAPFTIGAPLPESGPWRMEFGGFRSDGIPEMRIGRLPTTVAGRAPVHARWVCGHLLFARGNLAEEVPYDPDMYFSVEETTMALRAFTHGYDLYHPTELIAWHEYTRAYRTKHWDDHAGGRSQRPWHERREKALQKVARFFAEPRVERYGLGSARTLAEYETYAGISFRHRRVQDYTRLQEEPPNPASNPDWPESVQDRRVDISIDRRRLPPEALDDAAFWYVGIHDRDGRELFRRDASARELQEQVANGAVRVTLAREFSSEREPASWTVLPYSNSKGWLDRVKGELPPESAGCEPSVLRVLTSAREHGYNRVIYDTLAGSVVEQDVKPALAGDDDALAALLSSSQVFHLHWPELLLGPALSLHEALAAALRRAGVPVVWTQHNLLPHSRDKRLMAIYQLWASVALGVVHHSRWGQERVRARYRFRDDAVHCVIPHPHFGPLVQRDERSRREIEDSLGLRHDVIRLALIGAPRPGRDTMLAIKAVAACKREDIELTVYSLRPGEATPHDRRIIARPYEMVPRAEYDRRLQVTDALVMPIRSEEMLTTGTVGDAIAHGLPCLISQWPYLHESLGAAAIPYGSTTADLTRAIEDLTAATLGEARNGLAAVRNRAEPQRIGAMTLELLNDVAATSGRTTAGLPANGKRDRMGAAGAAA